MRINPFTFKKTKRIKQVTEHKGVSIDLTLQEAVNLKAILGRTTGSGGDDIAFRLYEAIKGATQHEGVEPTLLVEVNGAIWLKPVTAKERVAPGPKLPRKVQAGDKVYHENPGSAFSKASGGYVIKHCVSGFASSGNWRFFDTDEKVTA